MKGHGTENPRARSVSAAYPLTPLPSSRSSPNAPKIESDSGQEMPRPHDRSNRSTSAHSPIRRGRPRPRQVPPYLPLPSDIPANPDSPVSEQTAGLIHEFIHPHHHSQENLSEAEEELDATGGDAPVIAKELEEMRSRVWWRRPSALWYVLCIPALAPLQFATVYHLAR